MKGLLLLVLAHLEQQKTSRPETRTHDQRVESAEPFQEFAALRVGVSADRG